MAVAAAGVGGEGGGRKGAEGVKDSWVGDSLAIILKRAEKREPATKVEGEWRTRKVSKEERQSPYTAHLPPLPRPPPPPHTAAAAGRLY